MLTPSFSVHYDYDLMIYTSAGVSVTAIAAGGAHTCAVGSNGGLWCWGCNNQGQLGIGNTNDQDIPVRVFLEGCRPHLYAARLWANHASEVCRIASRFSLIAVRFSTKSGIKGDTAIDSRVDSSFPFPSKWTRTRLIRFFNTWLAIIRVIHRWAGNC